ncbi:DUF6682 family protein [Undibacterium sp. Rencai35W]|uniref:phage adaptor protein n=1 Tax=Undibacterium sp. Rencai35W TaxID=3413046 RepID=UPI003BF423EE
MARTFQMLVSNIITKARSLLNDTNSTTGYRQSDAELIGWLNDAFNVLLNINPALFAKNAMHTCVAGYVQTVDINRAVGFLEVVGIPEGDRVTLTLFRPNWIYDPQGATVNWMPEPSEPLRFDLYPPAQAGAQLPIRYIAAPVPFTTLADIVPISENYEAMLVEYVVGRAEVKDDEHTNSQRATQLMDRFIAQAKGTS